MDIEANDRKDLKYLISTGEPRRIAEPVMSYLKAALSARTRNINCFVRERNSAGYLNSIPTYIYPWGFSQILLNCPEIKWSDLEYFVRVFSPYIQVRNVEMSYSHTSTSGNSSESMEIEKWIVASDSSSFVKLVKDCGCLTKGSEQIPTTLTISEALRWYAFLTLTRSSDLTQPVEIQGIFSRLAEKDQIPPIFVDFARMFDCHSRDVVNKIQPVEGQRMIYVLGKCSYSKWADDSSPFWCHGFHSILLNPDAVVEPRSMRVSPAELRSLIISDYRQYANEDPANAMPRKKAFASLKSRLAINANVSPSGAAFTPGDKCILEEEGWIEVLPDGRIILGRGKTISELDKSISFLEDELKKQPGTWWNRSIEVKDESRSEEGITGVPLNRPVIGPLEQSEGEGIDDYVGIDEDQEDVDED